MPSTRCQYSSLEETGTFEQGQKQQYSASYCHSPSPYEGNVRTNGFSDVSGDDDDVFASPSALSPSVDNCSQDHKHLVRARGHATVVRHVSSSVLNNTAKMEPIRQRLALSASAFDSPSLNGNDSDSDEFSDGAEKESNGGRYRRRGTLVPATKDLAYSSQNAFNNVLLLSRQPYYCEGTPAMSLATSPNNRTAFELEPYTDQDHFVKAAALGLVDKITEYLSNSDYHVDIDGMSKGSTALHAVVLRGNFECTELLIKLGADCQVRNLEGNFPLHSAAKGNWVEVVDCLLAGRAQINARNRQKQTPLHIAVMEECQKTVELLLRRGAITTYQDENGNTPLHLAIEKKADKILSLLLEHGDSSFTLKNEDDFNVLQYASKCGYVFGVQQILKHLLKGRHPGVTGTSPGAVSPLSSNNNKRWVVDEPKKDGYTALHLAMEYGHAEIVALLLRNGSKKINTPIPAGRMTPLHLSLANGHFEAAKTFMRNCPNDGESALDLNQPNMNGDTALHLCMIAYSRSYKVRRDSLRFLKQTKKASDDNSDDGVEDFGDEDAFNISEDAGRRAFRDCVYLALMLIQRGGRLTVKNAKSLRPLDYCIDEKFKDLCHERARERRKSLRKSESSQGEARPSVPNSPSHAVRERRESSKKSQGSQGDALPSVKDSPLHSAREQRDSWKESPNEARRTAAPVVVRKVSNSHQVSRQKSIAADSPPHHHPAPRRAESTRVQRIRNVDHRMSVKADRGRRPSMKNINDSRPSYHDIPKLSITDVLEQPPPTPLMPYFEQNAVLASPPYPQTPRRRNSRKPSLPVPKRSTSDQEVPLATDDVFKYQQTINELLCPMCQIRPRQIAFTRCGHFFCQPCSDSVTKCPKCGRDVSNDEKLELVD